MARKKNMVNGVKVIRRHCAAAIFTGLICLFIAAILVLPLFFNIYQIGEFTDSTHTTVDAIDNTGMNFLMELFQSEASPFESLKSVAVWDVELITLETTLTWIEYILTAFMIVGFIYAILLLLYAIGLICRGHVRKYDGPRSISILTFILVAVMFVGAWGYTYCFQMGFDADTVGEISPNGLYFAVGFLPYLYLGVSLLGMIIIIIIYHCAFLNRVYVGDLPWDKEYIDSQLKGQPTQWPSIEANMPQGQSIPYIVATPVYPNPYMMGYAGQIAYPQPYPAYPVLQQVPAPAPAPSPAPAPAPAPIAKEVIVTDTPAVIHTTATLPENITSIGGHDYSQNVYLTEAKIPENISKLGNGAFSNCFNLETVAIPKSITNIGANCFFNCAKLTKISYNGTKEEWSAIQRGSNWLYKAGTTIVVCSDGPISVNPYH